ncbi:MAG: hypothetical protein H6829_07125 [Planctomycetes bacterium]|nr:hypothetical protein [Polyangiaceae bacterium]MCB9910030.1 hypothetical protein [Planctomycetota bacterium]
MKLLHPDGSLELEARPLQQVARQWNQLSTEEAASVFQQAFTEASILPNRLVVENARALAEEAGAPVPVSLVAVNDLWSVYAVSSALLAVAVQDGETVSLATLNSDSFDELGIPWPE